VEYRDKQDAQMSQNPNHEKLDAQQTISLILSVYVLGALTVEAVFRLSPQTTAALDKIDFIICFFFLYDFFSRYYQAESKLKFLKWGWIDFISSIPFWGVFQWARVARIIRILRALRSTKILIQYFYKDRAHGTLFSAMLIAMVMIIFSSIAVLNVEDVPGANIRDPGDALWWAFTTVSTVGYGDKYPITTEGRLIATLLIVSGVGLFAVYTAFIARLFIADDKKEDDTQIKLLTEEIRLLRLQVEALHLTTKEAGTRPEESDRISNGF
jgi:voltage-gated potassium channel